MILNVTGDEIAGLNDTDLRTLIGQLCEREVSLQQHSPSAVTWGGHQNAGDGGIDVRVSLPSAARVSGYIPKAATGFQVKAQIMPRSAIKNEMAPKGVLLTSIEELAAQGGAYIIVSSKDSVSDTGLKHRKDAMVDAVTTLNACSALTLDFYDQNRVATWVNQHAGLVPWVREKLHLPLSGWRPFADWSSSPSAIETPYLLDDSVRLTGTTIKSLCGLNSLRALALLRDILFKPRGIVRLVGLSGVGKTRFIQALFDKRIGEKALPQSDALYTDISDEPEPVPQEMLSRLVSLEQRVVMIVDNCGAELHRKLATTIVTSHSVLSLITVEYDIDDDEENPDSFKLEPASSDLMERILESRYPGVSPPSRHVIAKFSDGNSRVAIALAETAKNGESLVNLHDKELFKRLFYQARETNEELFDAAKACALLYSFDGETIDGDESELVPLATLAGLTVDRLHKYVALLRRRQLVQQRGKWRAILPHALAHRLAKRALEDIPSQRIEDVLIKAGSARMLRSFSRRIGYLHDDKRAILLVTRWFGQEGLLSSLGKLTRLGEEILENVAPVNPANTLTFFEGVAATHSWFFGAENENKAPIARIIRSIAYDPSLFERCVELLRNFAVNEVIGERDSPTKLLESLFWLCLSGTHATAAQRASFIRTLVESGVRANEDLGLLLLAAMLQTSRFSSGYSFEFGAWKRDYGFYPGDYAQIRDWYSRAIEVGRVVGFPGTAVTARGRRLMATSIARLLQRGMFDEVIALADDFHENGGWPEGWISIQIVLKQYRSQMPQGRFNQLAELERRLQPRDLADMIRSYALAPEWTGIDIADLEDDAKLNPTHARERIYDLCGDLGRKLVKEGAQFEILLPEIITSDSGKTFAIGKGVASACTSLAECWDRIKNEFLIIPAEKRRAHMLAGFLAGAMRRSQDEAEPFLDNAFFSPCLHPHLVYLQISAGINTRAFQRLQEMLRLDTVPVYDFNQLAHGRVHEALDDEQLRSLLQRIAKREGGSYVATHILGMRIFGRHIDKLPISESIRATGREYIAGMKFEKNSQHDHMLKIILAASFDRPEHEDQARVLCAKILEGIRNNNVYPWDLNETITALTKMFPFVVLDILLEQALSEDGPSWDIFRDMNDSALSHPLDSIPDHIWISWAALKPQSRYTKLAQVIKFSNGEDEVEICYWSASAEKLIKVAPEPLQVLEIFLNRIKSENRRNSLADMLESRMPLVESLSRHSNPEIVAWAKKNMLDYAKLIEYRRRAEAAEDRMRDETFE